MKYSNYVFQHYILKFKQNIITHKLWLKGSAANKNLEKNRQQIVVTNEHLKTTPLTPNHNDMFNNCFCRK